MGTWGPEDCQSRGQGNIDNVLEFWADLRNQVEERGGKRERGKAWSRRQGDKIEGGGGLRQKENE